MAIKYYTLVNDCIVESEHICGIERIDRDHIHTSTVSTIFLASEHVGGMFETMIMGGPADGFMIRCETAKQAREIHAQVTHILKSINWLTYFLDGNASIKIFDLLNNIKKDSE